MFVGNLYIELINLKLEERCDKSNDDKHINIKQDNANANAMAKLVKKNKTKRDNRQTTLERNESEKAQKIIMKKKSIQMAAFNFRLYII